MSVNGIEVLNLQSTGARVSADHFGGNTLFVRNTDGGVILPEHEDAIEALGITSIRYPAGQPDRLYENGMMRDGQIIEEAKAFFDWALATGSKVTVVLPTDYGYPGQAEMITFLNQLFANYAPIIDTVEIGNEYWGHMTETEYGQVAVEVIDAIMQAEASTGYDAEVLIQMANPTGRATAFDSNYGGWNARIEGANAAILDELSQVHRDQIDGVVEHYYFKRNVDSYELSDDTTNHIATDHQIWNEALGRDIPLHITEWNVKTSLESHQGMRAGVTIMEQFGFMMEIGVDEAYVWPPQHNTISDLAGVGDVIVDQDTGIVLNSINGAIFSMMSLNLQGLELQDIDTAQALDNAEMRIYASDDKAVIYVASTTDSTQGFDLDLGVLGNQYSGIEGIKLGYDQTTSDGIIWNPSVQGFTPADYVMLDGERYYVNEHDVQAEITTFSGGELGPIDDLSFSLKPYEIMQITVSFTPENAPTNEASASNDGALLIGDDASSQDAPAQQDGAASAVSASINFLRELILDEGDREASGKDRLSGGNSDLVGTDAPDRFEFRNDFGQVRVENFDPSEGDIIDLSMVSDIRSYQDLVSNHLSEGPNGAVITVEANSIELTNVAIDDLSAEHFLH